MSAEAPFGHTHGDEFEHSPLPCAATIAIFGSYDGKIAFEVWGPNDECIALAYAKTLHEAISRAFSINDSRIRRGDTEMDIVLDGIRAADGTASQYFSSEYDERIAGHLISFRIDIDEAGQPRVAMHRMHKPPLVCSAATLREAMDQIWAQNN